MVKYLVVMIIFLGELMSASVEYIKVKGVEIPVVFEKSALLPSANIQIVFEQAGSMRDDGKPGVATISAKLLNEGTKKLGAVEFAKKLENRAINMGVSSGLETMVIDMSALKSEFLEGLNLLKELLKDPNLTKEALKKAKTDVEGALLSKQNDFDYIAQMTLIKTIFAGTPLENPNIGTLESLKKIALKDAKEHLRKYMVLNRVIIVAGGDIELDEIKKPLTSILELFEAGEKPIYEHYTANNQQAFLVQEKDTKQAYIYFGAPYDLKPTDADSYKAKVATFILGAGGFGSRMMEEVRVKRGLAYSAHARLQLNKTSSYLSGLLQTKLENQDEAIKVVREVIDDFIKNGANEKELDGAKKFLLGSEPLRNELLHQRLGTTLNEFYKELPLGHSKNELKKIEALSLDELNSFIKSHKEIEKLTFSVVTKNTKK